MSQEEMTVDTNVPEDEAVNTFGITGDQLANKMMSQDKAPKYEFKVQNTPEDVIEDAKKCPWFMVRSFFDDEVSKYTATAQAAMTSKDWSPLKEITLSVTMNENNGKYCCWECGGARSTFGHAVIIGAPDGRKPLAMSAFRKCKIKNNKQAVIQVWPSYIVAMSVQNRGTGVVLLYRIAEIKVTESVFVQQSRYNRNNATSGEAHNHFSIVLQLNKVIDITTHEVLQFMNDLNHITPNSDIVKAAMRKATIFNCDQAIYIRPFFYKKDGDYEWDINSLETEDTIFEENAVSSFLTEALTKFSSLVRGMPVGQFPYMGLQVLEAVPVEDENDTAPAEGETKKFQNSDVVLKFAIFSEQQSNAWVIKINRNIFRNFRDFFPVKGYNTLVAIATNENNAEQPKTFYCKYSGN